MRLGSVPNLLVPKPGTDPIIGRIEKAAELGLSVMNVAFREPGQREPDYLKRVTETAGRLGVELRLMGGGGETANPDPEVRKRETERAANDLLELNRLTGIKFSMIVNRPMSHNRWAPQPPMSERIDIIAENLGKIADAVAPVGMVLGLENHCDYRGYECAAMLEKANRPNLKAQFDTGNPFTVFEEPVEAAKAMAKWTVSCHLKDVKVTPLKGAPVYGAIAESAPMGQGNVDNVTICQILQDQSPDPKNLALMLEPLSLAPSVDVEEFMRVSLEWCRDKLAPFLS